MHRRYHHLATGLFFLFGISSLSGVSVTADKTKLGPALTNSIDENATASSGLSGLLFSVFREPPSRTLLILSGDDPSMGSKMADLGAETREIAKGFHVGKVPVEALRYLSNWPSIRYVEPSRRSRKMLDISRPAIMADIVQNGTGAGLSGTPFTGAGSYVGVVDTGLYAAHRDFYENGNLSLSRIDAKLGYPGFTPGIDTDGHGTHVTGIAAGNGYSSRGSYTGIAPDSRILSYATDFDTADILSGVSQLFSAAGVSPVSINLSLGLMEGPHDGTSIFEKAVNDLGTGSAGSRRIITVAAGNEGDMHEHFQTAIPLLGGSSTVQVLVPTPPNGYSPGTIDVWASGSNNPYRKSEHDEYRVTVSAPTFSISANSGNTVTSSNGELTIYNRIDTSVPNGATHIAILPSHALKGRTLTITFTRTWAGGNGMIDAYLDAYSPNEGFLTSTPSGSIIEPANGDNVIAVGAWVTRTSPDYWGATSQLAQFSSLGPTRDGRAKPDITAPGANIYSTRSRNASGLTLAGSNDNYAIMSGTSMATPHITGLAALIWESNPSLTGAQMRERIRLMADGIGDVPNYSWGFGKTNALKAVASTVASISAPPTSQTGSPVLLDSSNSSGAFGNALNFDWSLSSKPSGSTANLDGDGATALFTPDKPGDYTVSLTATQSDPAGILPATATRTIHANRLPTLPVISGPGNSDNNDPVDFSASSSDPEGAPLSWNWVLVSRPAGSLATLSGTGSTATLDPDVAGSFFLGVRSNDGMDNSILSVHTYSSGGAVPSPGSTPPAPSNPQSSGGGCSGSHPSGSSPAWDMLLLLVILFLFLRASTRPGRSVS